MVNILHTSKQYVATSVLGVISSLAGLIMSFILDHFINSSVSNLLGLITNYIVDFFIQQKVFTGKNKEIGKYTNKYFVAVVSAICLAQLLYMATLSYTKKYHKKWYKDKWEKYVTFIRWCIKAIVYTFFEFPLHKFWVFY